MLKPVRVAAPARPLVTLPQVKARLRIEHARQDAEIEELIAAATARLDGYAGGLGRCLINQTWRVDLCEWPRRRLRLPLAPVSAVTAIGYRDMADAAQTLAASSYRLHEDGHGPFVAWTTSLGGMPGLYDRPDAVSVTFVAGYGAEPAAVPADIIRGLINLIEFMYRPTAFSKIDIGDGPLPVTVEALVGRYRRIGF